MYINIHTHRKDLDDTISIHQGVLDVASSTTFFSVGVHPWDLSENPTPDFDTLLPQMMHPKCIAIGECGIDRVHRPLVSDAKQSEVFLMQANIAQAIRKPLILHCVRAADEIITFRNQFFSKAPIWIYHGFERSSTFAAQLSRHNIIPSLGPRCLDRIQTQDLRELYDIGFFLETDDSELPIHEVYARVCDLLNISTEELEKNIYARFCETFHLNM